MDQRHRMGAAAVLFGCTVTAILACAAPPPSAGDTPRPAETPASGQDASRPGGAPAPEAGGAVPGTGGPAAPGTGAPAPGTEGPGPSTGGPVPGTDGQERLAALAGQVEDYLRRRFPGHFASVVLDVPHHTVIVYRRPSARLDAALGHRFPKQPIRPRDAAHSARELDAIARRVTGDVRYWQARGVTITTIAVRPDGSAVEVGTTDVAKAARELPKRYGRAPLKFVKSTPTLVTPPTATG
ncbi:hypothetical protein [Sphaerisporangium dianthi]|uniref:Uncharacterized protein n=1 Tax=Sphaerisporangium dianthi TaxID=1436120 RepID=A0ABV9CHJ5_9ACTN